MTDVIQDDLAARDLLPGEHLLDSGYVDAQHLRTSAQPGICLQRLDAWWTETPRITTRTSRFAALAAA